MFNAQDAARKAAILVGVQRLAFQKADPWTASAIKLAATKLTPTESVKVQNAAAKLGPSMSLGLSSEVGKVAGAAYSLIDKHSPLAGAMPQEQVAPAGKALAAGGQAAAGLIQKIPLNLGPGGKGVRAQEAAITAPGVPTSGQLGKNALKDVVNLPAEALPSVAIPISEAAQGHWHAALHDVTAPVVALGSKNAWIQHPVDNFLMASGLLHGATRIVDTAQSVARGKGLPNVKAESVQLTGGLTHERPDFSKSPITRFNQKQVEKALYKRNAKGYLVPRDDLVRSRLIKLETSRLVGQNERVRVHRRMQQVHAHAESVLLPRGARAAYNVRKTLTYDPKAPLIPGAEVLARIADGTVKRPETVVDDLENHLREVLGNRIHLDKFPQMIKDHEEYVTQIKAALKNKGFLRDPEAAFRAAERYAQDYAKIEKAAHALGHFRDMTKDALDRRRLAHATLTHMHGAEFDRDAGLVRPGTKDEVRAEMSRLRGRKRTLEDQIDNGTGGVRARRELSSLNERIASTWDKQKVPLKTDEMRQFVKTRPAVGSLALPVTERAPVTGRSSSAASVGRSRLRRAIRTSPTSTG